MELAGVSRDLGGLESQFLQHLDLLKRGVLGEMDYGPGGPKQGVEQLAG